MGRKEPSRRSLWGYAIDVSEVFRTVSEGEFSEVRGLGPSMRAWPSRVCAPPGAGRQGA
jgi:hypothetical protein